MCLPPAPRGVVVLVHGLPSADPPDPGDDGYAGFARRFAESGWAGVWADLRGARASPGWFSIEGWVRDARAVVEAARTLDGLSDLPTALVGSSAGGAVSVEAARRGAPVDALVLLASPADWVTFADDAAAGVRRVAQRTGMELPPDVLTDPSAWAAEFSAVVAERAIAEVRAPTLVVHGDVDEVVPVEHAARIAARRAGVETVILPGAPHHLRRRPGIVELLVAWLEGVLSGAPRGHRGAPR